MPVSEHDRALEIEVLNKNPATIGVINKGSYDMLKCLLWNINVIQLWLVKMEKMYDLNTALVFETMCASCVQKPVQSVYLDMYIISYNPVSFSVLWFVFCVPSLCPVLFWHLKFPVLTSCDLPSLITKCVSPVCDCSTCVSFLSCVFPLPVCCVSIPCYFSDLIASLFPFCVSFAILRLISQLPFDFPWSFTPGISSC